MKKCLKCAELVQPDATICKHCGFKFPDDARLVRNLLIAAIAIGGVYWCSTQDPTSGSVSQDPAAVALDAKARASCAQAIDQATKDGIVRQRPAPNRVNVEEAAWQLMPADQKRALLSLVACDAFGKREADLDAAEYAVAYGFRNGRRLAMLSSADFTFD